MSIDRPQFVLDADGIRYRLAAQGLDQNKLAELTGLTPAAISQKLNNQRNCSLTDACLIADVLDCRLEAIIKEA